MMGGAEIQYAGNTDTEALLIAVPLEIKKKNCVWKPNIKMLLWHS